MENPKKLKVAVIALSIVLGGALCALAWALWQNHWWRISVDELANEAGISWAMRSFRRGQLTLWESNPTNDSPRFSGRRDGPFDIWLDDYHDGPAPWHYAERKKLDAHNKQMRYMYDHPERFTPGKDEQALPQRGGAANRSQPTRSGTNQTSAAAGSDR